MFSFFYNTAYEKMTSFEWCQNTIIPGIYFSGIQTRGLSMKLNDTSHIIGTSHSVTIVIVRNKTVFPGYLESEDDGFCLEMDIFQLNSLGALCHLYIHGDTLSPCLLWKVLY
jgi:hypothetical protein